MERGAIRATGWLHRRAKHWHNAIIGKADKPASEI
jgi:hypothetical protein